MEKKYGLSHYGAPSTIKDAAARKRIDLKARFATREEAQAAAERATYALERAIFVIDLEHQS